MNIIKRVVSVALIGFLCMGLTSTESRADSKLDRIASSLEPIEIRITDPDEIRAYLEEQGEAYDENLVEVVRHIYPTLDNDIVAIDREISDTEDVVDYSEFFRKILPLKK